jgi:hypothetical protein
MKARLISWALLASVLLLGGCGILPPRGLLYTHTTTPLDVNHNVTPREKLTDKGEIKRFSYSLANVAWDSNAIGDIAKRNGIEVVYYVDKETFSILRIWSRRIVHVYGK